MKVFTNVTADGATADVQHHSESGGGNHQFCVFGTFDGASVQLEFSPDNKTTWLDFGTALTAAGFIQVDLNSCDIRATISSAGAGTDLSARML